jgi:hypothetical protein
MKMSFKLLLPLLLLSALPAVVQAQTYTNNYGIWSYAVTNSAITITEYTGPGGTVTIPSTINGLPVTGIGDSAFNGCTSLTSVIIPDSVISIGDYEFEWCFYLASVAIGTNVTSIGDYAFASCGLTSVTIPDSVTYIGDDAFYGCPLISVTIPDSVTSIGELAFCFCDFASVTIGNSVTNIGDLAFYSCTSLTSLTIPGSVISIGNYAYCGCGSLTGVYFAGNAPSLGGANVFLGDSRATVYYLPGTTGWEPSFGGLPTAWWLPTTTSTLPATGVSNNSATLNGVVNPSGCPTTAWFQWGATTNYGNLTSATNLGSGTTALPLSALLAGLTPAVTYHFRIAATNHYGLTYGSDQSFTTAAAPPFSDDDWVSLGSGMGDGVCALAVSGTNLYAGGHWSVSKWNGSSWSDLHAGIEGLALAVSGTNLYAGGFQYVLKWNGNAWSALATNMYGYVEALAAVGTTVYAGGSFIFTDQGPANKIAKWNGRSWSALEGGVSGQYGGGVLALAMSGTDLYVGGSFQTPGPNIAKWDGNAWSAFSGMNGGVCALAVSGTNLYAGGDFTTAGGVPANNIAKWDGSNWSALGSGMNDQVLALAVDGTNLYAGGYFTRAGGVAANYIAKWDGSTWSALGSGVPTHVFALAADGVGHLFVGGFVNVGGVYAGSYVAEAILVPSAPSFAMPPPSQTAEAGTTVHLAMTAVGEPAPTYQWYFNGTNGLSCTSSNLILTNILFSQCGPYTVVASNEAGAVTSAPAMLNVIAPVERRPVWGVKVTGQTASLLSVDYADSLSPAPVWTPLGSVSLASTTGYCCDPALPLPPQRFYRAWQSGTPSMMPSLDLHLVPAITLTGNIGDSVRVDYINQFGPTDAWVTLDILTLTNTSQLYFDTSSIGQPGRLYRVVQMP